MRIGLLCSTCTLHCNSPLFGRRDTRQAWRGAQVQQRGGRWRASSQGFEPQSSKKSKKSSGVPRSDKKQSQKVPLESNSDLQTPSKDGTFAPTLSRVQNVQQERRASNGTFDDRLEAIKRSAEEKKSLELEKMYGPIDYEAPTSPQDSKAVSLPVKVGIGIGVVVFGLIFAFGDLLPSREMNVQKEIIARMQGKDAKDSENLKEQLQGFLAILKVHPEDLNALEGAAVTYAELGDFSKSETTLLQLLEKKPLDVDALRLLGEVQNALGKYGESTTSYRKALKISPRSITLWKGLAEALVSQGKPDTAVEELASERDRLRSLEAQVKDRVVMDDEATLVQINLLLGKTYVEWGHIKDALAVYDSIIKDNLEDFRGYLAKGILLRKQGRVGEAERMFIQAKFFAPESMKGLVERYSKG